MSKKRNDLKTIFLVLLLLFSLTIRTWAIDSYPAGFTQDEASFGYDAYSLLLTGKDQWGNPWPVTLRSFGDFKLPVYSYLAIPSVYIFGLDEFSTRLPSAIIGTLAVLVLYLMVIQVTQNKNLAFVSSLFLAFSPWHISLSRGAFEANLTIFFITAGIWAFAKGLVNKKFMALSSILFAINLFTYHSARMLTPLVIVLLILFLFERSNKGSFIRRLSRFSKDYTLAVLIFLTFSILAISTFFFGSIRRGSDILITNPTDKWASVSNRRYEAVLKGEPDFFSRLFSNKGVYVFDTFFSNYLSYLSPTFLFTQGAGEWTYGMIPGRGVMYLFQLLFVLFAFYALAKGQRFKGAGLFVIWFLISPIPAALTKGPGFAANRAVVMVPSLEVISAFGAVRLYEIIQMKFRGYDLKNLYYSGVIVALVLSFTFFAEDYIYHAPIHGAKPMHYGVRETMTFVMDVEDGYDEILISRSLSVPQIWVAFYGKVNPSYYQAESKLWLRYEVEGLGYVDQLGEYRLGKFMFGGIDQGAFASFKKILIVGRPEEFPSKAIPLFQVDYPDGKPAYLAVENRTLP